MSVMNDNGDSVRAAIQKRRRIDWEVILQADDPVPHLVAPTAPSSQIASWLATAMSDPSEETADLLIRRAVEYARTVVQLERAAVFLVDATDRIMIGSWGTDAKGATVDEHDLQFDLGDCDREVFARAKQGFPWTVYDDCPLIAQGDGQTRVLGRGWVACTAIPGSQGAIGLFFNDTALTRSPIDEAKQARAAILCALLGQSLETCRARRSSAPSSSQQRPHPLVRDVTRFLADDPSLNCDALADRMHVSAGWLARMFKRETKTSLVDYRNELRLARFLDRVDARGCNLLEAALDSGFGSYAQFHRVFRARFGLSPRSYLLERVAARARPDAAAPAVAAASAARK